MFKVLLIDDEPSVILGLKTFVKWNNYGFELCGEALNGEDALQLINELKPDLVVTDIKMPVIDGLQLIKQVNESVGAKPRFIILSGYDEFSYAKTAMQYDVKDYILKPLDEEEIKRALVKIHAELESGLAERQERDQELEYIANSTVSRVIKGEKKKGLANRLKLLLGIRDTDKLRCVLIEIDDLEDWLNDLDDDEIQARSTSVKKVISDKLSDADNLNTFEVESSRYLIIFSDRSIAAGDIGDFVLTLQRDISDRCGWSVSVFIGNEVGSVTELEESYKQALTASGYKFYKGRGSVISYEDVKSSLLSHQYAEFTVISGLLEDIENFNSNGIKKNVEVLFEQFKERRLAPDNIEVYLNNLGLEVGKIVSEMNGDMDEFIKSYPIFELDTRKVTIKELESRILDFCIKCSDYINILRKRNSSGIISEIEEYIKKNYSQNINLKTIAAQFFMSPVYLGRLFEKTVGRHFNDYLHELRIEEAKKLLRRTDMKIYEIANMVGYSDPEYFMCKFVKIVQVPPSSYRKVAVKERPEGVM